MSFFYLLEISVSWALVALIWVVQLVHYPAFLYVDAGKAGAFHQMHTQQITFIVMPLMLLELGLAIWRCTQELPWLPACLPLVLVAAIWASTFFIQVPLHGQLGQQWDEAVIRKLINTNWLRTVLWTVKGGVLLWWMSNR